MLCKCDECESRVIQTLSIFIKILLYEKRNNSNLRNKKRKVHIHPPKLKEHSELYNIFLCILTVTS